MHRALAALFGSLMLLAPVLAQPVGMSDAAIIELLKARVEVEKRGVGMVVGILENGATRIVAYGGRSVDDPTPVDGDTLYEIGSITKVFTGLLLADAIQRGDVRLDQPVAELLPPGTKVPERGGKQITLFDLTTHTSGLPRLPTNFAPAEWANPYADYTPELLYAFLASYELPRDIGVAHEYSNLGVGLLGHALALKAGMSYADLVRTRILEPLGMTDTSIALSPDQAARLAIGHDEALKPTANWDMNVLEAAGGLRSTANDLLKFLTAAMDAEGVLAPLFAASLTDRRYADQGIEIGFGWLTAYREDEQMVWHSGSTGGYRAFAGYLRKAKIGVVALSNAATLVAVDDLATHLLDPGIPLVPPPVDRIAIVLPPEKLDAVTGTYELAPGLRLAVRHEDGRLMAQATAQEAVEIFPESETAFFYKIVDAQLVFTLGADGKATSVTLHQLGAVIPGPRVE